MTNIVTIPLKEYEELKAIEKAYNREAIMYRDGWGSYYLMEESDAFKQVTGDYLSTQNKLDRLRERSLIKRLLNKD